MSLKKYMAYDLLMLGIFSSVLEGVAVWCSFYILAANAASVVISILVLYCAIVRWKWWGLTIAPLLALGSFVGGLCLGYDELISYYPGYTGYFTVKTYFSILVGLLSIGLLIFLIFRKKDFQEKIKRAPITIGYGVLAFVLYEVFKNFSYFIMQGTNQQFLGTILYDLIALVFIISGSFILNKQGYLLNVKQKILDDKKDQEEEASHETLNL